MDTGNGRIEQPGVKRRNEWRRRLLLDARQNGTKAKIEANEAKKC